MNENKAIVFKISNKNNDPEIVKFGTRTECEAYMFNILIPRDDKRNMFQKDSDFSTRISLEQLEQGEWVEVEYFVQSIF